MGIFTGLLLLPIAPLRGTIWVAEKLAALAEQELSDEATIRRLLVEAEMELDSGRLSPTEYELIENELLDRLEHARALQAEEGP